MKITTFSSVILPTDRCISCRFLLTRNQIPMKHRCKIRFVWMHYWESDCVWTSVVVNHASEGTNQFPENYNLPLMSTAVISLHILSDLKDPFLSSQLNMFNTWIQSTYAVILWVVGMNCTRDGASENRDDQNHRIRPLILWLWVTVAVMTDLFQNQPLSK